MRGYASFARARLTVCRANPRKRLLDRGMSKSPERAHGGTVVEAPDEVDMREHRAGTVAGTELEPETRQTTIVR